jgi:RNA polymerase sigma-70 factor (ECF subfamily)
VLARLDASDVVQEVLVEAHRRLDGYLASPPLPFHPWLRQIAWEVLVKLHQRHLQAQKRRVGREAGAVQGLPDSSALELARRLCDPATGPSGEAIRAELRQRVQSALMALAERDREVLVLRHLEGLSVREVAEVLGVSEGTVKTRQVRALARLQKLLAGEREDDQ